MRGGGVLLVGGAPADVAVDDDQGRATRLGFEVVEGGGDRLGVVGVDDVGDVPAVAGEPGRHVVVVGEVGFAVDRDVVVVVDPAEVVELQVAGDRGGLAGDPLHQAAVAGDRVDVEVEEVGPVAGALPLRGDRHPDRGRDALSERPGGRLHPRGPAVLGVAGGARVELAEALDVGEADRRLADHLVVGVDRPHVGQVQQRVEQHRGVPGRKHEAIASRPDRVGGIEAQEALPERVGERRQRHRRPRMPRVRLLDRVDRKRPDRVDAELVDVARRVCHRPSILFLRQRRGVTRRWPHSTPTRYTAGGQPGRRCGVTRWRSYSTPTRCTAGDRDRVRAMRGTTKSASPRRRRRSWSPTG